jgi:hypothetical protein
MIRAFLCRRPPNLSSRKSFAPRAKLLLSLPSAGDVEDTCFREPEKPFDFLGILRIESRAQPIKAAIPASDAVIQ